METTLEKVGNSEVGDARIFENFHSPNVGLIKKKKKRQKCCSLNKEIKMPNIRRIFMLI